MGKAMRNGLPGLFLALTAGILGRATCQTCDQADLQQCMEKLRVLTSNEELAFAYTEKELQTVCGHLQSAMKCVNKFTERCFDTVQQDLYRTLTSGAQELISSLCTEGSDFRTRYLKHAACYKDQSEEFKRCAYYYLKKQEEMKSKQMATEEQLRISCCLFDGYVQCTRKVVLAHCDEDAANLTEHMVSMAGGPLIQMHCRNHRSGTPQCHITDTANIAVISLPLLLLMAILGFSF